MLGHRDLQGVGDVVGRYWAVLADLPVGTGTVYLVLPAIWLVDVERKAPRRCVPDGFRRMATRPMPLGLGAGRDEFFPRRRPMVCDGAAVVRARLVAQKAAGPVARLVQRCYADGRPSIGRYSCCAPRGLMRPRLQSRRDVFPRIASRLYQQEFCFRQMQFFFTGLHGCPACAVSLKCQWLGSLMVGHHVVRLGPAAG